MIFFLALLLVAAAGYAAGWGAGYQAAEANALARLARMEAQCRPR